MRSRHHLGTPSFLCEVSLKSVDLAYLKTDYLLFSSSQFLDSVHTQLTQVFCFSDKPTSKTAIPSLSVEEILLLLEV
jgi:hypothetical protein